MLSFSRLDKEVEFLRTYFENSPTQFCDLSVGVRFMWREDFKVDYALFNDTLILKESTKNYTDKFYFPIAKSDKDIEKALVEIENYCLEKNIPLSFCCIDNKTVGNFLNRYSKIKVYNDRDWSDYIYLAESFKTFSGKKFSGQRNHINKFKKLYPNYIAKKVELEDLPAIFKMLDEFEDRQDFSAWSAKEEKRIIREYIENSFLLNQLGIAIFVDDKVVGISFGECVKDTLIVHVEKALTSFDGVYPLLASEFAKAYATENIKFINREEDCGDNGLRISKLQYKPIEVKEKNFVDVLTLFDNIYEQSFTANLGENFTIDEILENDKEEYQKLYLDDKLNKYWGYDYLEDLGNSEPTPNYFYNFMLSLKDKKQEYSLAIKKDGVLVGEVVFHNFDYFGGVEIGFRLNSEYHRKGITTKAVEKMKVYAKEVIKAKTLKGKCLLENLPSKNLFIKLGFSLINQDEKYFYFEYQI